MQGRSGRWSIAAGTSRESNRDAAGRSAQEPAGARRATVRPTSLQSAAQLETACEALWSKAGGSRTRRLRVQRYNFCPNFTRSSSPDGAIAGLRSAVDVLRASPSCRRNPRPLRARADVKTCTPLVGKINVRLRQRQPVQWASWLRRDAGRCFGYRFEDGAWAHTYATKSLPMVPGSVLLSSALSGLMAYWATSSPAPPSPL